MGDRRAKNLGDWGEKKARKYLEAQGFEYVAGNVRTPYGEIDLVMRKGSQTHFVEVKTRTSTRFGHPEDAVDAQKLSHMVDSALGYLQENPEYDTGWQIDVIAIYVDKKKEEIEIEYFENAVH